MKVKHWSRGSQIETSAVQMMVLCLNRFQAQLFTSPMMKQSEHGAESQCFVGYAGPSLSRNLQPHLKQLGHLLFKILSKLTEL